jgi:hypothetical protein
VVLRSFFVPTELVEVSGKIPIAGLYEMLQIISFVDRKSQKCWFFDLIAGIAGTFGSILSQIHFFGKVSPQVPVPVLLPDPAGKYPY